MSETKGAEQFSARDSALGYLYQVRLALLWALRRLRLTDEFNVGLETLDDVVFESDGRPTDLLQAKHRVKRVATLTDASPDIWKTFRVWLTALGAEQIDATTRLVLVSTGICDKGTAAYLLGEGPHRNENEALVLLNATARSSSSQENQKGYALFLALSEREKLAFLACVVIMDGAPLVTDVEQALHAELRFAVPRKRITSALEALEGWWFTQMVRQLSSPGGLSTLASQAIELRLDDIREQCRADVLLVDNEILQERLDQAALAGYAGHVFAKQVMLVTKNQTRLNRAITDYTRAYAQRSKWLRGDMLLAVDDERFRGELFDEWEIRFARTQESLEADPSEENCVAAGAEILAWVESDVECSLNTGMKAPWVARGTLHEMSDQRRVGWHPNYEALLEDVTPDNGEESRDE
ncbi:conserved hypothetical protein [Cupriavidus taiwanensis]|nr:conserved hypothetical protein [Cupriavidus taiwanensis]SOY96364.1 conserved hypothetical protein [Cupriavidus taiwanensis]